MRPRLHLLVPFLLAALLAGAVPTTARGQVYGWVSLDGSPEGTPADLAFDGYDSDAGVTRGHVAIHGFWRTPMSGPGRTTFDDIVVPGMSNFTTPGVPRLPVLVFDVGVMTGASAAGLEINGATVSTFDGYYVWPSPEEAPFEDGAAGAFAMDSTVYFGSASWPEQPGAFSVLPVGPSGLPPAARVSLRPFRWNPATLQLEILRSFDFALFHPGSPPVLRSLPQPKITFASLLYFNWGVMAPNLIANANLYEGSFLFVVPPAYESAIAPLVLQKQARGFKVTQYVLPSGSTCASIRNVIRGWRDATSVYGDRFCILVGDDGHIPWCRPGDVPGFPTKVSWSDRPYAVLDDLTQAGKDVLVGRLPGSTPPQVADMVLKTLVYENASSVDANHARALLVGDRGQNYFGYSAKQLQEKNRTTPWTLVPDWVTQYGEDPGVTNATLDATLETGAGLVVYLGQSTGPGWSQWNLANEDFFDAQVAALSNGPYTPVLWAATAGINQPDVLPAPSQPFLGASWLRHGTNGAVASYACDSPFTPGEAATMIYQRLLVEAFGSLQLLHGYAIASAEQKTAAYWNVDDLFRFSLFGDPQMTIRVSAASQFAPPSPAVVSCPTGSCTDFTIALTKLADGRPLPGAKVAVYKRAVSWPRGAGAPGAASAAIDQPEVQASTYTDGSGVATLELPRLAAGTLYYTVETADGAACFDSLQLSGDPVSAEAGAAAPFTLRAEPSLVQDATTLAFGRPLAHEGRLDVFDMLGRRVAASRVPAGATRVRWQPTGKSGERLAGGIYLVRIADGADWRHCRLVVR